MSDLRDDTIADLKAQLLGATASNEGLRKELEETQDRLAGYVSLIHQYAYSDESAEQTMMRLFACTALLEERTRELEEARALYESGSEDRNNLESAMWEARDEARRNASSYALEMAANELALARATSLESENAGLRERVTKLLDDVDARLAKGKGTWPGPDYVRDDDWARWLGEASALRDVLAALSDAPPAATAKETHAWAHEQWVLCPRCSGPTTSLCKKCRRETSECVVDDSPNFSPDGADDLKARGYERVNRIAPPASKAKP